MPLLLFFRLDPRQHLLMMRKISSAFLGTNATLYCVSPLRSCVNITWYHDISLTDVSSWYNVETVHDRRPRDKYVLESYHMGCKLTVTNVSGYINIYNHRFFGDAGRFQCRFMNASKVTAELFLISK